MNFLRAKSLETPVHELSSSGNPRDHLRWILFERELAGPLYVNALWAGTVETPSQTISQGKPLGPPYVNSLRAGNPGTHSRCPLKDFCFTNKQQLFTEVEVASGTPRNTLSKIITTISFDRLQLKLFNHWSLLENSKWSDFSSSFFDSRRSFRNRPIQQTQ